MVSSVGPFHCAFHTQQQWQQQRCPSSHRLFASTKVDDTAAATTAKDDDTADKSSSSNSNKLTKEATELVNVFLAKERGDEGAFKLVMAQVAPSVRYAL